ncbi:MAG: type II toxin-antitoxin system PemK/MazF family toxin [Cyanobacteria bacterium SBLK]|nr:type II toxin-antitoxin system PemK/MazF family toxin [Cyanobacteria bacterium SBLK]
MSKQDRKKSTPKRGEIYWAKLDPTEGSEIKKTRPVVVVSSDSMRQCPRTLI